MIANRTFILLLLIISIVLLAYPTDAQTIDLTPSEHEWLNRHKEIRLAIDIDWAPFEYVDAANKYVGMAADYMKLVEDRLGIQFQVDKQRQWPQMVEGVKKRELDVFSCVVKTSQREQFANFTKPYLSFPMIIVTLTDEPFVDGINDLIDHDRTVAVVESYASYDLLQKNHPHLDLLLSKNVQGGLEAVSNGRAYAFVGNLAVVSQVIREKGITNLKVSGQTPYRFDLSMAVRKDWPELIPILEKALGTLTSKKHDQIFRRWIAIEFEEKVNYTLILYIVATFVLIVAIILIWNRSLQTEVRKRGKLEIRLQQNQESLVNAQAIAHLGNWDWDFKNGTLFWSDEIYRIFGLKPQEFNASYDAFIERIHPDDRKMVRDAVTASLDDPKTPYNIEHRIVLHNGQHRIVQERGDIIRNDSGAPVLMRGTVQDITEYRVAEENVLLSKLVIQHASESIVITDHNNYFLDVNPAFEKITGYCKEEVLGNDPKIHKSGRHDKLFYKDMWHSINQTGNWSGEIWDRRKNGEIYPKWLNINTILDNHGKVKYYVGIFSDISQQKSTEEALEKLAFYDPLTNLPNRTLFRDRLQHEITRAKRENSIVALFFIDLDRFKYVNDTFGHNVGDELLVEVATRILFCTRKSDTVCRLGGDEFTVILANIGTINSVGRIAEKIIKHLQEPIHIKGNEIFIGASIGITIFPADGMDYETLTKNADLAMYQAKKEGRGIYRFFSNDLNTRNLEKHALEIDLRQAIQQNKLILHYQPKIDIEQQKIIGMEALLRWQHPQKGLVSPLDFIPLAEETGLILPMGEWALREACRQTRVWNVKLGKELRVAVNLSAKQFLDPNLFDNIAQTLNQTDLPAHCLELEITESSIMENISQAIATMKKIRDLGIHISIDDFGTGYSSLSYLKSFPLHSLKIDKSFINDLATGSDGAPIVESILSMAHAMKLSVVAEGVETEEQLRFLKAKNCTYIQGFFYSKPLEPEQFINYVQAFSGNYGKASPD